jgi:hypothetical protein
VDHDEHQWVLSTVEHDDGLSVRQFDCDCGAVWFQ